MNKKQLIVAWILLFIFSCFYPMEIFAKENPKVAALTIQQLRWTKSSFRKAEKRLAKVNIGMTEIDFFKTLEFKLFKSNGKTITFAADGFILKLGENVINERVGHIQTYVFGYVDKYRILHEQYFVVVENKRVIEKINLDEYEYNTGDIAIDVRNLPTRDEYLKALESVENIRPGMWTGEFRRIMRLVGIWTGRIVTQMEVLLTAEGEFYFVGPGYLRFYEEEKTESGLEQRFTFGYEEDGEIIQGFTVHLNNLQVTDVEYLLHQ